MCRTGLFDPSATTSQSHSIRYSPSGVATRDLDAIVVRVDADDLVLPAQLDAVELSRALHQILLEPVLLEIDERRTPMTGLGKEIEAIDELVAEEDLADVPADALVDDRLRAAQPVEDLERSFRVADRARAHRHRAILVEHDDRNPVLRVVDRSGEPDGAGADDDDRPFRAGTIELRRANVRINRIRVGLHCGVARSAHRAARPICAVSFRGPARAPCRAARSRFADRDTPSPRRRRATRRRAGSGRRSPSDRTSA